MAAASPKDLDAAKLEAAQSVLDLAFSVRATRCSPFRPAHKKLELAQHGREGIERVVSGGARAVRRGQLAGCASSLLYQADCEEARLMRLVAAAGARARSRRRRRDVDGPARPQQVRGSVARRPFGCSARRSRSPKRARCGVSELARATRASGSDRAPPRLHPARGRAAGPHARGARRTLRAVLGSGARAGRAPAGVRPQPGPRAVARGRARCAERRVRRDRGRGALGGAVGQGPAAGRGDAGAAAARGAGAAAPRRAAGDVEERTTRCT